MIAIINRLPVKDGAADRIVERVVKSRGHVQGFRGSSLWRSSSPTRSTRYSS
jgi:heme-degrading monooxygenase HmoA